MNIVNVGYDSTNYYVLADSRPKLLSDVGWPGTLPKLQHQCQRAGIDLPSLKHFVLTHYHPDHAGLAQELKLAGCQLIVLDTQVAAVPALKRYMKPQNQYREIDLSNSIKLNLSASRAFLSRLGIEGEIVGTPGHSDDSISLVLDMGAAFTGDLTPPVAITDENTVARQSWEKLRSLGVTTVYPGHGPAWYL